MTKKRFEKVPFKSVISVFFADLIVTLVLLAVNLGLWHRVLWWAYIPIGILTLVVLFIFFLYLLDRNYRACPKCRAKVENKANFCTECGAHIPLFCPSCKNKIKGSPKFCQVCGYDLRTEKTKEPIHIESNVQKSLPGYCGTCGAKISEKAKFCPLCGSEQ